jgi:iron complex transport system ATP-binding protein
MADTLYTARKLTFGYRPETVVIRDVDFAVRPGELVALIGPNGAGKSTLLKLLIGLHKPSGGSIEFNGRPLREYSHRSLAREVAYLPQEDEIHFPFTVGEVVMLGRWPHSGGAFFDSPSDREAASKAMTRVGISDWSNRVVTELSGGERARVILAKAIATQPRCLLLDEPVSELDLRYRAEAYRMIRELANDGLGIVVVAHDVGSVARWADRFVLMAGGEVVADGSQADVLNESVLSGAYGIGVKVISDGVDRAVFASIPEEGPD